MEAETVGDHEQAVLIAGQWFPDMALELATNAACHTHTKFTVLLEGTAHEVLLTVSDGAAAPPVLRHVSHSATAGRGMHIVSHYSRDWGVVEGTRDTKSVWASFGVR